MDWAELSFDPVFNQPIRTSHYAGVVDQDVDLVHRLTDINCGLSDRSEGREVELEEFDKSGWTQGFDFSDCGSAPGFWAAEEQDFRGRATSNVNSCLHPEPACCWAYDCDWWH